MRKILINFDHPIDIGVEMAYCVTMFRQCFVPVILYKIKCSIKECTQSKNKTKGGRQ